MMTASVGPSRVAPEDASHRVRRGPRMPGTPGRMEEIGKVERFTVGTMSVLRVVERVAACPTRSGIERGVRSTQGVEGIRPDRDPRPDRAGLECESDDRKQGAD